MTKIDTEQPHTPIFIIGVHRSGTTLLRFILSSHPHIYIPPESDFIPKYFLKSPTQILGLDDVQRMLSEIFSSYRFVKEWKSEFPDPQNFYASMPASTPQGFLTHLYSLYAGQYHALRWGDKTPIYTSYLDLLFQIFPGAAFIHILRDPRDAAVSLLEKYQTREFHVDIYFAARNWVTRVQKALSDAQRLPPAQYLEIRYEQLVSDPEKMIHRLCDFLGETFHPRMLHPEIAAQQLVPTDSYFFSNVRNPINPDSIGRWRTDLSPEDTRLIQFVAGNLMRELGYPLIDIGKMGAAEKLRLASLQLKYETLQQGRKVIQAVGLKPPI
jgi:hypothetical protein